MKALVISGDARVCSLVRDRLLGSVCDEVVVAGAAEPGLCHARERSACFDIVILDLDLPDDGLLACRRLVRVRRDVPILTCSIRADEASVLAAFEAGAHDFIAKPVRLDELAARTRALLRLREERRKHAEREQRLVTWARQLEKTKRDLESTICIDPLTGIANRGHFDTLLRSEWRRAIRDHTPLSIVLFDLDDFHAFNDHYGHVGGDVCLVKVTKAMAHGLRRASDVLARYGGEELVAVLPDTDARGACVVAERLRARVEELGVPHAGSRCSPSVTLSAGVATRASDADVGPETLIAAADAALFRAKRDGRNCCRADGLDVARIEVSRQPWPVCPVVVADPGLARRISAYLETLRGTIVRAPDPGDDLAHAALIAQRVRRSSAELGFHQVLELGARIEDATRRSDADAAGVAIRELAWYLGHVQVVYRRVVSRV